VSAHASCDVALGVCPFEGVLPCCAESSQCGCEEQLAPSSASAPERPPRCIAATPPRESSTSGVVRGVLFHWQRCRRNCTAVARSPCACGVTYTASGRGLRSVCADTGTVQQVRRQHRRQAHPLCSPSPLHRRLVTVATCDSV
jgi:hypothetical protein